MEVGAVKQAFNNEVIHLKKGLNQAKIHTIHKLTRKAKTFGTKKASDKLKDKLKRKAEAAVNEVLLIKKIKPRDVARFIVTHKGNINDYINRPEVDQNKACARLLLHKALQEKYKTIRDRFGNIPINDLLMSRHERRKLKKELKENQQNKKKGKNKTESNQDVDKPIRVIAKNLSDDDDVLSGDDSGDEMSEHSGDESSHGDVSDGDSKTAVLNSDTKDDPMENGDKSDDDGNSEEGLQNDDISSDEEDDDDEKDGDDDENDEESNDEETSSIKEKLLPKDTEKNQSPAITKKVLNLPAHKKTQKPQKRKENKNKNKNINEKILKRKFNKLEEDAPKAVTVVDPFFKTSSGANYMSLAEPRAPDEVKEVHKQGNRQYRRAVMFGHVPKSKPRNFNQDKFKQPNKFNRNNETDNRNDRFNKNSNSQIFNNDRKNKFNREISQDQVAEKPEKLHPSWEAKKKLSSVLPFQGKKIKFDDS